MVVKGNIKKLKGLVLFGDSVFFGIGASSRDLGCGKLLKNALKIPVLIKSKNRDTTFDALVRIETDRWDTDEFSHVLVMFGNNDCRLVDINKPQVKIDEYKSNLQKIMAAFRKTGMVPLLVNLQPIDSGGFSKHLSDLQYSIFSATQSLTNETPYSWQKKYSDACEEITKTSGIKLINIRTPLENLGTKVIAADGLHPNNFGHKVIAETVINFVNGIK